MLLDGSSAGGGLYKRNVDGGSLCSFCLSLSVQVLQDALGEANV